MKKNAGPTNLVLSRPRTSAEWLAEPDLLFASGARAASQKVGIALHGPRSLGTSRHRREVHIGFIGTREAVSHARSFYSECSQGVDGDEVHTPFPGCTSTLGFRCDLVMNSNANELITRNEERDILGIDRSRDRFERFVGLLDRKLQLLAQRDFPLDYVVLALSDELYKKCRVADYVEKGTGKIHRDLHRSFKALAMRYQKPTQIVLESTISMDNPANGIPGRLDHRATIAWNLFTGLYFKIDGLPWGPLGLTPSTCYIGVSFFKPPTDASSIRTSVIQAFDENGEGLVLRGHNFSWDERRDGRTPHLPAGEAAALIQMVLERYEMERGVRPRRIVIHKTSRFEEDEREGFEGALRDVAQFDLVAVSPTSSFRLIRSAKYPPYRGTAFTIGDISYLYTTGYSTTLDRYPHGHVPTPLQIADHVGDTDHLELLNEIMVLTKMNWNSAALAGHIPITLRFSRLVGDILKELPEGQIPSPKYKFYM